LPPQTLLNAEIRKPLSVRVATSLHLGHIMLSVDKKEAAPLTASDK
jgi:hypothetical protein